MIEIVTGGVLALVHKDVQCRQREDLEGSGEMILAELSLRRRGY